MPRFPSHTDRDVLAIEGDRSAPTRDALAIEEPLEIRVGPVGGAAEAVAVTMRTPEHDEDLAAGFALTEGLVEAADEIESVTRCSEAEGGNVVIVALERGAWARRAAAIARNQRAMYVSSSCGLCGRQTIDRIEQRTRAIEGRFTVTRAVLAALPQRMREGQATFDLTGGLHAAAIFEPGGERLVLREDVGRHNAVDKAIGCLALRGRDPIDPAILMVSGRASFEIMQKAARAGIAMVCAVSAPSSLAVDFAERIGQTLVGFLRGERMNVYAQAQRVTV